MAWELPVPMPDDFHDQSPAPEPASVPPPPPALAAPAPVAPLSPADVGVLPDVSGVLGPVPQLPLPGPPPAPPRPMEDPRQQLAALIALGAAVGLGPHGGGGAALHGFVQTQQALQHDAETRHQQAVQENLRQQAIVGTQQRAIETDYRQREANLQRALLNFQAALAKAPNKAEADRVYDAYGNTLGLTYRTINPDFLRANFRYTAPGRDALAGQSFDKWLSNPLNKQLLEQNPQAALASTTPADLNGDGQAEKVTIADLADAAGRGFAKDPLTGQPIVVPKPLAGSSEFTASLNAKLNQFRAENSGHDPNPQQYSQMVNDAIDAAKGAGASEFDRYVSRVEQERGHKLTSREIVSARREYFGETDAGVASTKQQAAQAVYASVLRGDPTIPRPVVQQVQTAGLDLATEVANARKRLMDVGRGLMSEMDRANAQDTGYDPEALIARARKALLTPPGSTKNPPTLTPRSPEVRAEAKRQLETARKASGDARVVTDADVDQVLARPGNLDKIRKRLAAGAQ